MLIGKAAAKTQAACFLTVDGMANMDTKGTQCENTESRTFVSQDNGTSLIKMV